MLGVNCNHKRKKKKMYFIETPSNDPDVGFSRQRLKYVQRIFKIQGKYNSNEKTDGDSQQRN